MSPPPTDRFRRRLPWTVNDLIALYAATFVGILLVFVAWFGASGAAHLSSQVRWTNVGVAGVIVLGAGNLWWLLRARRTISLFRESVLPEVWKPERAERAPISRPRGGASERLVSAPGMTRFHLASCPLAAGKDVTTASEAAHRRAGREACGVCLP